MRENVGREIMVEIELERSFLAKRIPSELENCKNYVKKEIIDLYLPKAFPHPTIRIRKQGNNYIITKKVPLDFKNFTKFEEQSIKIEEKEFNELLGLEAKKVEKERHYFDYKSHVAEVDVFKGDLEGLVVIEFEFKTIESMNSFEMPDFCLADVSKEEFIAGGFLCGKKYSDIEKNLEKFGYIKLKN
ncbi:MAG: hypothetical protein ABH821_03295 [archaeon]